MTDHQKIHVALARFMGWRETPGTAQTIPIGSFVIDQSTVWRGLHPRSTHEPWAPTTNPAQAVEVMAEVARRGGRVETLCQYGNPPFTCAHVYLRKPDDQTAMLPGSAAEQDSDPAKAWCRALSFAVVEAIEGRAATLSIDFTEPGEPNDQDSD